MSSHSSFSSHLDLRRYDALVYLTDLMVHHGSLTDLFQELTNRLHQVTRFDFANFSLHDPEKNSMRLSSWSGFGPGPTVGEYAVEDTVSGWVWQHQQTRVMGDLQQEFGFPKFLPYLREQGMRSYCVLPLTTRRERLGAIGFASSEPNSYSIDDVKFLGCVAELCALAVENALVHDSLQEEKQRLEVMLDTNTALLSKLDVQELFTTISAKLRLIVQHDYAALAIHDGETDSLKHHALDFPGSGGLRVDDPPQPARTGPSWRAYERRRTILLNTEELRREESESVRFLLNADIRSLSCIPLRTSNGVIGTLSLGSKRDKAYNARDLQVVEQVASTIAIALGNSTAYQQIKELKSKLTEEKLYLEDEIRSELHFDEIVGESSTLRAVLAQAKTVAPSDANVLILGETGTGKELIARAIHRMSSRRDGSFIKLNCAAIPTGLLESELFGHEKGAFTGAISQKLGRMELAHRGTLLLDEIGDIPLELQPKLLRVLQDHEFERLGGTRTIGVNVRLIASTNRDLAASVSAREFRSDLYYRLNVFPIHLPPLRERVSDIPLLVRYFVQKISRRMNKRIETIPADAMTALINWTWPGNIRELENFIERAVILSEGDVLRAPLSELKAVARSDSPDIARTLENMERLHIIRILRETGGVIGGSTGAAARLGLKRTTLQSRMQKLGISRQDYQN